MGAWATPRADWQPTTLPSLHISVYLSRRRLPAGEQRPPPAGAPCGLDQKRRKRRPPETVVRKNGEPEQQRQRVCVKGPKEPQRAQQLAQERDHHQMTMPQGITSDPPIRRSVDQDHHAERLPAGNLV